MGRESFHIVRFDLGPLLQGQTRIAKLKSVYNSLSFYYWSWRFAMVNQLTGNHGEESFDVVIFYLGPSFKVKQG